MQKNHRRRGGIKIELTGQIKGNSKFEVRFKTCCLSDHQFIGVAQIIIDILHGNFIDAMHLLEKFNVDQVTVFMDDCTIADICKGTYVKPEEEEDENAEKEEEKCDLD